MKNTIILICIFLVPRLLNASVIAVVDSGVDISHRAFASQIWLNANETSDGADTDGNGFIDDLYGWNFADDNNQVFVRSRKSSNGHGTHVAGIALGENHRGRVLAIKMVFHEGPDNEEAYDGEALDYDALMDKVREDYRIFVDTIITYIGLHQVDVANFSFGESYRLNRRLFGGHARRLGMGVDQLLGEIFKIGREIFQTAVLTRTPDTLFVLAAGNERANNDRYPTIPAAADFDGVISVAASWWGRLANFSNYGVKTVDVAAPGVRVHSTLPGNRYGYKSGTSMSAPYVTGVASGLRDINPSLSPGQMKRILLETVDVKRSLRGKIKSGGEVNKKRAWRAAELSLSMSLNSAIAQARVDVGRLFSEVGPLPEGEVFVAPVLPFSVFR